MPDPLFPQQIVGPGLEGDPLAEAQPVQQVFNLVPQAWLGLRYGPAAGPKMRAVYDHEYPGRVIGSFSCSPTADREPFEW